MGFFSWQCAKTHTSIPVPQAGRMPEHGHVHLYLPQGQRIEGSLDGAGRILLEEVYERDEQGQVHPIGEIEDTPWIMDAGGYAVDIFQVVGAQVIPGFSCREDAFRGDHFERINDHIKLVKDKAFDHKDTYDSLEVSKPCPYQGFDYDTHARVKHLYGGDAPLAYLCEFTHELPGSPEHNGEVQRHEAMEAAVRFATSNLEPSELKAVYDNTLRLKDLVLESGSDRFKGTSNPGDEAGYSYGGNLLPIPCVTWEQTELALLAALQTAEFKGKLTEYLQRSDSQASDLTMDDCRGPGL